MTLVTVCFAAIGAFVDHEFSLGVWGAKTSARTRVTAALRESVNNHNQVYVNSRDSGCTVESRDSFRQA